MSEQWSVYTHCDPYPWVTFRLIIAADNLWRRQDAMRAILRWPGASASLREDALLELLRCEDDWFDWNEEIDAAKAAWTPEVAP